MGLILAFDIATNVGWACGLPSDDAPQFGSHRFTAPGSSHASTFGRALQWFDAMIVSRQPSLIVHEETMPDTWKKGLTNHKSQQVTNGLPAIMQAVAFLRGIYAVHAVKASDVRGHFILRRNLKRAAAKRSTVQQCRALGWDVQNDDEADACAIFSYARSHLKPELALVPTPLFGKGAA